MLQNNISYYRQNMQHEVDNKIMLLNKYKGLKFPKYHDH